MAVGKRSDEGGAEDLHDGVHGAQRAGQQRASRVALDVEGKQGRDHAEPGHVEENRDEDERQSRPGHRRRKVCRGSPSLPCVPCLAPMRNPRHTLPVVTDHEGDGARTASAVRNYYEGNTRLFLSLGIGGKTLAMRRAVWATGVQSLSQAVDHVNGLIAAEILSRGAENAGERWAGAREARGGSGGGGPLRVLDIGCGVGGSLFFLCGAVGGTMQGVGVTISPRQADVARRQARLRGLARQLSFLAADFTTVVGLPPFHCAFAIESFVHFSTPDVFFAAAARSLEPGGRLVVVDDFLSRERFSPREGRLVLAFQKGWILSSLCTVGRAAGTAAASGLRLVEDRNLSPCLSPLPVSAPVIASLSLLAGALPVPWSYWRSTAGSLALAACQKAQLGRVSLPRLREKGWLRRGE